MIDMSDNVARRDKMPFSGERLAPRGNPKSWSVKSTQRLDNFNMRVRTFINGVTERCDVEIEDGTNKRRIHAYEGPHAEIHGEGFIHGYAAGVASAELKPLTPPPKRTAKKRAPVKRTLDDMTKEELLAGLRLAVKESRADDSYDIEVNALDIVERARKGE